MEKPFLVCGRTPSKFLQGDDLILECEIDTTLHETTLLGGISTHEEMCNAFLDYYPRHDHLSDNCYSRVETGGFAVTMGAKAVYPADEDDDDYILTNEDGYNDTYIHWVSNYNWTRDESKYISAVQNAARYNSQVQWCTVTPKTIPAPPQWFIFTPLPSYSPRNDTDVYCHQKNNDKIGGVSTALLITSSLLILTLQL